MGAAVYFDLPDGSNTRQHSERAHTLICWLLGKHYNHKFTGSPGVVGVGEVIIMRQFEPSCGTEACRVDELCGTCERDRAAWSKKCGGQDSPEDGCPKLAIFGMDGRHPDIMIDDAGDIKCCDYVPEGEEIPEIDTETLPLFPEEA